MTWYRGDSKMKTESEALRNALRLLQKGGIRERYGKGETILRGGQLSRSLYVIVAGVVEIDAGFRKPFTVGPGAIFGENGFLEGQELDTVVALEPTEVTHIGADQLLKVFSGAETIAEVAELLAEAKALRERRRGSDDSTPEAYVAMLAKEALQHRAVHHPYLRSLAEDTLPDVAWALRDFATQYLGYSRYFPNFLTSVIAKLDAPEHRNALLENLIEEQGRYGDEELKALQAVGVQPEWIQEIAHPVLFARFAQAVGAPTTIGIESDEVVCWRELFLAILGGGSAAEAVGALGLGTENIVSQMYRPFAAAIARLDLDPRDTVFFPLHTMVDDHHQAVLQRIAASFAGTEDGRSALRRGMIKALNGRSAFWDWLYERAQNPYAQRVAG